MKQRTKRKNAKTKRLENENERYRIAINEMAIIISKAIEYIETYKESFKNYIASDLEFNVYELLDILKGDSSNE